MVTEFRDFTLNLQNIVLLVVRCYYLCVNFLVMVVRFVFVTFFAVVGLLSCSDEHLEISDIRY